MGQIRHIVIDSTSQTSLKSASSMPRQCLLSLSQAPPQGKNHRQAHNVVHGKVTHKVQGAGAARGWLARVLPRGLFPGR